MRARKRTRQARRDDHVVGLFVVERLDEEVGRWSVSRTYRDVHAAQNYAWELLTREGGSVRVRQGRRIIAKGMGCSKLAEAPRPSTAG